MTRSSSVAEPTEKVLKPIKQLRASMGPKAAAKRTLAEIGISGVSKEVESMDTDQVTAEIECRAQSSGHRQPADPRDLVLAKAFGTRDQAVLREALHAGDLDGSSGIHPRRTVQGGRRHAGDHPFSARREPGPDRPDPAT